MALSKKDNRLLALAAGLALASDHPRVRIGAVVVAGGRIVGRGYNTMRNDPSVCPDALCEVSFHAEQRALRDAGDNTQGAVIYVARPSLSKNAMLECRPCPRCRTAIFEAGIKRVIWTTDYGVATEKVGVELTWPDEVLSRRVWQSLPPAAEAAYKKLLQAS